MGYSYNPQESLENTINTMGTLLVLVLGRVLPEVLMDDRMGMFTSKT